MSAAEILWNLGRFVGGEWSLREFKEWFFPASWQDDDVPLSILIRATLAELEGCRDEEVRSALAEIGGSMKVWGIKAAFEQPLPPPGTPGVVTLRRTDPVSGVAGDMIALSWTEVPTFTCREWLGLSTGDDPLEFDHARDSWAAPRFVRCLYLRTSPDQDHYVAVLPKVDERLEFARAGGDALCGTCGKALREHPHHPEPGHDGKPFLRVLCDGRVVKL